jgi:hypothetical protein
MMYITRPGYVQHVLNMYVIPCIYLSYACLVYLDISRICILYITYLGKVGKLVKYLPIPGLCTYLGYLSR